MEHIGQHTRGYMPEPPSDGHLDSRGPGFGQYFTPSPLNRCYGAFRFRLWAALQ